MSRRTLIIARNDVGLLLKDPTPIVILVLIPLVMIPFLKPAWAPLLKHEGHVGANGAEQAVPGTAVLFAFYVVVFGSLPFYREYVWNTWDRLRAAPISTTELLVGKVAPTLGLLACQQAALLCVGVLAFGLDMHGSAAQLVAVDLAYSLWIMAFLLVAVAYTRTFQQVVSVANLGAILLAALGGALTPLTTLPDWAQSIAPVTPTYWAMRGYNHVLLDHDTGIGAVALPCGVLIGAAVAFVVLAALRFNLAETKGGTLET